MSGWLAEAQHIHIQAALITKQNVCSQATSLSNSCSMHNFQAQQSLYSYSPMYTCVNVQAFIVSTHIPLLALARISTDETLHCLTARLPSYPPTVIRLHKSFAVMNFILRFLVDRCSSGCHILDFMYSSSEPSGFSICALRRPESLLPNCGSDLHKQ